MCVCEIYYDVYVMIIDDDYDDNYKGTCFFFFFFQEKLHITYNYIVTKQC